MILLHPRHSPIRTTSGTAERAAKASRLVGIPYWDARGSSAAGSRRGRGSSKKPIGYHHLDHIDMDNTRIYTNTVEMTQSEKKDAGGGGGGSASASATPPLPPPPKALHGFVLNLPSAAAAAAAQPQGPMKPAFGFSSAAASAAAQPQVSPPPSSPSPMSVRIKDIADRVWIDAGGRKVAGVCAFCQTTFIKGKGNPLFQLKACLQRDKKQHHLIHIECLRSRLRQSQDLLSLDCLQCFCSVHVGARR